MFPQFRIIYKPSFASDPCVWQLQERFLFIFWKDVCGSVSSATTAAHEMERMMRKRKMDYL